MSTKPTYTPQAGSLPSMVIGFFQNNPDEELTLEDIAEKFGGHRSNIHTNLSLATQHSLVVRDRNEDGDYIYKAGKALARAAKGSGININSVHSPQKAPKRFLAPRHALDIDALKVDTSVPYVGDRRTGVPKWQALFDKLGKVGHSVVIPVEMCGAVNAAARKLPKAKGTYRVAKVSESQARVWRTA